jgi:putative sigma-54 modulation protein
MRIDIIGTNYNPSNQLKELIQKKSEKLDRYFDDNASAKFVCSKTGGIDKYTLEATIWFGGKVIRVEETSDNIYDNVYVIIPKIERMVRKYRTKLDKKLKDDAFSDKFIYAEGDTVERQPKLVKSKEIFLKPLSFEDAVAELELLDHDFYLYLNETTSEVNVVYRRRDGEVGVIACKN